MPEERVILVNNNDEPIGTETKLKAHKLGKLHRAFSVFVFYKKNDQLQLLLQQRNPEKYHSGGLWTNACCSHPRPTENIISAANRRLKEEMGISVALTKIGNFQYKAEFPNGLIEHEFDHVLLGFTDTKTVDFNTTEISAIKWISIPDLIVDLEQHPRKYTAWFKQALDMAVSALK